ncbi:uncharacterized protein LOC116255892 [Nymphaea colorata]|uniref:uncharacterized protein LOC116255892 n=1 Tax=Nymphaea colorata TaxID=210225 RepID=UPI00129D381E|nr:uncharacterized protein LOC116255892 [Nymphaea colorata]
MTMGDASAAYIRLVQHLIEKCLLFNMNQEECVETLSRHANIKPVITTVVWKELEKENKGFFEAYSREMGNRRSRAQEAEAEHIILQMINASDC